MINLKTLQDIGDFDNGCSEKYDKLLRAEAVKDIKKMKNMIGVNKESMKDIKVYIMWKFNLTEDDLK